MLIESSSKKNKVPRRKYCEHPTRHSLSHSPPKAQRSVSSRLDKFIRHSHRYDRDHAKITELCAKCYAFENQQMVEDEAMEMEKDISSNDDISGADEQEENVTEEEENDSNATNDEESNDIDDGKETDDDDNEKEEEEEEEDDDDDDDDDSFHELTYKQQQAFETLSSIFRTLNVSPIHDR